MRTGQVQPDGCACVLRAQVWDFGRPTMQVAVAGLCAFSFLWGVAASLAFRFSFCLWRFAFLASEAGPGDGLVF